MDVNKLSFAIQLAGMLEGKNRIEISGLDVALVLIALLLCVNPFFVSYRWTKLTLLIALFARFAFVKNFRFQFDKKIIVLFLIVCGLALVQGIIWKFSFLSLFTMFAFEVLTPYFIFKLYSHRFFIMLEKVVFGLTLTAVIIWSIHELYHPVRNILIGAINFLHPFSSESLNPGGVKRSLLFYTFMYEDTLMDFGIYRNSGFAHEPGGFAVFANFGLMINLLRNATIFSKRNAVYVLAILSTFSTAGIISMFFIVLIAFYKLHRPDLALIASMIILPVSVYLYVTTDFLGAKIEEQIKEQSELTLNESTTGRLFGARKSWNVLTNHPLTGRGLLSISRPASRNDPEYAAYGWLSDVSRYGAVFGFIGFFLFIKGFLRFIGTFTKSNIILALALFSFLISLSSQNYIANPVFFAFTFVALYPFHSLKQNPKKQGAPLVAAHAE